MPIDTPSETIEEHQPASLTAFAGMRQVARGPMADVLATLRASTYEPDALVRVFDDQTGAIVEVDLRPEAGTSVETPAPVQAPAPPRGVGRPRLGVVAREVTLLPRHWEWLNRQPGGASVALRRLVEDARRVHRERDELRAAQETSYRVMTEMAGDLPDFEQATRALFAGDEQRFAALIEPWPQDLKTYLNELTKLAWTPQ